MSVPAFGSDYSKLGRFEKAAVDAVLKKEKLMVAFKPAGKTVGKVRVINLPVFSGRDSFLRWFNIFHVTTLDSIIRREVLLKPGETWNQAKVDETVRNLRNPILSNVVVVLPVTTDKRDVIDLLVVTRDVWSLRLNSNIQVQEDDITLLSFSLAENNFLGLRKQVAVQFNLNQGMWEIGPRYIDPNIAGTRLRLSSSFAAIFDRENSEFDGTRSSTTIAYPLWSLATPTGGSVTFSHYDAKQRPRYIQGRIADFKVRTSDNRVVAVPYVYEKQIYNLTTRVIHSMGHKYKHHVSYGYELTLSEASVPDDLVVDARTLRALEEYMLPRSEISAGPWVGYRFFTPKYGTYRDFKTYDLREDYLLGPELRAVVDFAPRFMGSTTDHTNLSASVGYAFDLGMNSYLRLDAGWFSRVEASGIVDHSISQRIFAASPKIARAFRLVSRIQLESRLKDSQNGEFTLGGDSGLRGYPVGFYAGSDRFRAAVEMRSVPLKLAFMRLGSAVFWEAGHAADGLDKLKIKQNVGVGIRYLIPQVNPFVFRLDWAFALHDTVQGWPGRISLGFFQAF